MKTLIEELEEGLAEDGPNPSWADGYPTPAGTIKMVSDEYVDSSRWYEQWTAVFQRNDEFAAVDYSVPATEMQEVNDDEYEVYAVVPREVTVIKYEKV